MLSKFYVLLVFAFRQMVSVSSFLQCKKIDFNYRMTSCGCDGRLLRSCLITAESGKIFLEISNVRTDAIDTDFKFTGAFNSTTDVHLFLERLLLLKNLTTGVLNTEQGKLNPISIEISQLPNLTRFQNFLDSIPEYPGRHLVVKDSFKGKQEELVMSRAFEKYRKLDFQNCPRLLLIFDSFFDARRLMQLQIIETPVKYTKFQILMGSQMVALRIPVSHDDTGSPEVPQLFIEDPRNQKRPLTLQIDAGGRSEIVRLANQKPS